MEIKLKMDFNIPVFDFKIKHADAIYLMGSCFSDEIGNHFKANGFKSISNPFGTIFHPIPLANNILDSLNNKVEEDLYQRKDLFFSWDAAENIFDFSSEGIANKMQLLRKQVSADLKSANILYITFGTAFQYLFLEKQKVVANCHKAPGNQFSKSLTPLYQMVEVWEEVLDTLKKVNPELQIVFTVSPVRHSKDGLIENNRSKARLFELISTLEANSNCHYFPSYEIIIDELRDYRFYKLDGVHPNDQAVEYVWNCLSENTMDEATRKTCEQVLNLRRAVNHRTLHENSNESVAFKEKNEEKLKLFLKENPNVCW
jgi:hypothetical protein